MATKSDKVTGNERAALLRSLREMTMETGAVSDPVLSSARTGFGVRQLWRELDRVLIASGPGVGEPHGTA